MTDPFYKKAAEILTTPEGLQKALAKLAREGDSRRAEAEHQRAEALAANIVILQQALQCVRNAASDALADTAPERTIMVVAEDGEIIACCLVSDAVASDRDKTRAIRDLGSEFRLSIDFVEISLKVFTSAEARKRFLRSLNGEEEDRPVTT